jgi:SpoVK/Ycf46/Vps4 family AAA+-type ATPase
MLSSEPVSGGISGAEAIAVCRDAALLALEEEDTASLSSPVTTIAMRHLLQALKSLERQITPEMLQFYRTFQTSSFDYMTETADSLL